MSASLESCVQLHTSKSLTQDDRNENGKPESWNSQLTVTRTESSTAKFRQLTNELRRAPRQRVWGSDIRTHREKSSFWHTGTGSAPPSPILEAGGDQLHTDKHDGGASDYRRKHKLEPFWGHK